MWSNLRRRRRWYPKAGPAHGTRSRKRCRTGVDAKNLVDEAWRQIGSVYHFDGVASRGCSSRDHLPNVYFLLGSMAREFAQTGQLVPYVPEEAVRRVIQLSGRHAFDPVATLETVFDDMWMQYENGPYVLDNGSTLGMSDAQILEAIDLGCKYVVSRCPDAAQEILWYLDACQPCDDPLPYVGIYLRRYLREHYWELSRAVLVGKMRGIDPSATEVLKTVCSYLS